MSILLQPHRLEHSRLPCPSVYPRVCSNSCPLSQWCRPTISFSITPFSSCPQSFPESKSFPMSQLFALGDHSIGTSASVSVLPMNIQGWFPLTGLISLQSKGLSRVFSSTRVGRHESFSAQHSLWFNSHLYMTTGKTLVLTIGTFVSKIMALLSNTLSRLVIAFLPRNKCLNFMATVTVCSDFGAQENKVCHCFHFFPIYPHEVMGPDAMIFIFWMLSFKPDFHSPLSSSGSLVPFCFSAIKVALSVYLKLLIFLLAILIPAYESSSPAFPMMYSANKLNKQGDKIQPWRTPFLILNQPIVLYLVLMLAFFLHIGFSGDRSGGLVFLSP